MFLIYFLNNLILLTLFYWYNKKLFQLKEIIKYTYILITILTILKSVMNLSNSFQVNLIFTIVIYFVISYILFEGSMIKKGILISFFIVTSFVSELCAYIFLSSIFNYYPIQNNSLYIISGNFLSGTILFLISYLVTKIKDINDMLDSKGLWYFVTFPLISIIIIYLLVHSNLLDMNPLLCLLIAVGIIAFNIIICIGFVDIIKSKNIQIENEKLKRQELHYLLLEEKIDNSRQFIHDFKKHINLLNGYMNSYEFDKLKSYLNELSLEIKNEDLFVITGNQLIDLSINANKKTLLEHSIDIKYDVKLKNLYPISDLDFNIVFSNILDNAIESCIRTNGHFIKIKLDSTNDLIMLKVINPCSISKKNYETLKKDKECHGYGIKNVRKIIQKYNGLATFKFEKEENIFISTVIFKNDN